MATLNGLYTTHRTTDYDTAMESSTTFSDIYQILVDKLNILVKIYLTNNCFFVFVFVFFCFFSGTIALNIIVYSPIFIFSARSILLIGLLADEWCCCCLLHAALALAEAAAPRPTHARQRKSETIIHHSPAAMHNNHRTRLINTTRLRSRPRLKTMTIAWQIGRVRYRSRLTLAFPE